MAELSTLGAVIHEAQAPLDSWKGTARAATDSIIVRSGLITVDGVLLVAGDVVLDQHAAVSADRGLYIASAGAWSRASSAPEGGNLDGAVVRVMEGTINGDKTFAQNASPCVVGTDAQTWLEQAGGGGGDRNYSDVLIGIGESRTVEAGQQMLFSGTLDVLGTLDVIGEVVEVPSTTELAEAINDLPPAPNAYPSKVVLVPASQAIQFGYLHSINAPGVVLTIPSGAQDGDMFAISNGSTGASLVATGGTLIFGLYDDTPLGPSLALEDAAYADSGQRTFTDLFLYSALANAWQCLQRTNYPAGPLGALPIVSYGGGGTLNALPGVCYRITADCLVQLPAATGIFNARIAVIKDYVGAGPSVAANGADVLMIPQGQFTGAYAAGDTLLPYARLEWQAHFTKWMLVSEAVQPAQHLATNAAPVSTFTSLPPTTGQVLKAVTPIDATWQDETPGMRYEGVIGTTLVVGKVLRSNMIGAHAMPSIPADGDVCALQGVNVAASQITLDTGVIGRVFRGGQSTGAQTLVVNCPIRSYFAFQYSTAQNAWHIIAGDISQALGVPGSNRILTQHTTLGLQSVAINDGALIAAVGGGPIGPLTAGAHSLLKAGAVGQPEWDQSFADVAAMLAFNLGNGPRLEWIDNDRYDQEGLMTLPFVIPIRNDGLVAIPGRGAAVFVSSDNALRVNAKLSRANAASTAQFLGVTMTTLPIAPSIIAGGTGRIVMMGIVKVDAAQQEGVWLAGERIYISVATAGKMTNVEPSVSLDYVVPTGTVLNTPAGGDAWLLIRPGEIRQVP